MHRSRSQLDCACNYSCARGELQDLAKTQPSDHAEGRSKVSYSERLNPGLESQSVLWLRQALLTQHVAV